MAGASIDNKAMYDGISAVSGGVDMGKSPILVRQNQLSYGINIALRGGFIKPRPGVHRIGLSWGDNGVLETRQKSGRFQVAGYYKPDSGPECILASIGGRQFRFNVGTDNSVQEITISYQTQTTANFVPPAIGFNVTITVVTTARLSVGAGILVNGFNYTVETIISPTQVAIKNVDDDQVINPVPSGSQVISYDPNPSNIEQAWELQAEKWWILRDGQSIPFIYDGASARRAYSNLPPTSGREIGPGRMMDYVKGRIWGALTDDRSFRAGDLVGSSSGLDPDKRDAVLKETENVYLNGGGNFTVPMSAGEIRAIRGASILDTSLGQGPVQIFTPDYVFSVNAPFDRTEWQNLLNPIQTVSQISYGGLSHYATINVNGDFILRSVDGIRSYILARREFSTWGNTPISREVNRILQKDTESLLRFSSEVVFGNRLFITASPVRTAHGIYHRAWISLDFDQISSMGEKARPIYDGGCVGLNILQFVKGKFNNVERCFAFSLNAEQEIELYEITKDDKFDRQEPDGEDIPINWIFETGSFRFDSAVSPEPRIWKKLTNCELELSELTGNVHFKVYWKPDSYPCWILWKEFDECAKYKDCELDPITGCQTFDQLKPQNRPNLSLGKPPDVCDSQSGRILTEGFSFQLRFEVSGYCELRLVVTAEERMRQMYRNLVGCP